MRKRNRARATENIKKKKKKQSQAVGHMNRGAKIPIKIKWNS